MLSLESARRAGRVVKGRRGRVERWWRQERQMNVDPALGLAMVGGNGDECVQW